MRYPNPILFQRCAEYFQNFIDENENFSRREIAAHFDWPASFLPDLISGRKNLTVLRAMEFAEKAGFSPVETEHLIFLGIRESSPERYASFFSPQLQKMHSTDEERSHWRGVLSTTAVLAVVELLKMKKIELSPQDIVDLLPTYEFSIDQAEEILQTLLDSGALVFEDGVAKVSDVEPNTFQSEEKGNAPALVTSAESFISFNKNPVGPCHLQSIVTEIPESMIEVFQEKFSALSLWMKEKIEGHQPKGGEPVSLFQFDLHLFPICSDRLLESRKKEKPL